MGGRLKALGLLAAMFALGAMSGITWDSYRLEQQGAHHVYLTRRVKKLKHQLHLSVAQEKQLQAIIQNAHAQARTVHEEISPDMAFIHDDTVDAIRAILTPAQRTKFDKLHNKAHETTSSLTSFAPPTSGLQPAGDNNADS